MPQDKERTGAHGFHLPPGRKPPRRVRRVGIDSIEAIFEFATVEGRGAGIIRLSPTPSGDLKAWLISTTLEELRGHEEKIGDNRPTGAAYSRNFGGDNWDDMRQKARAFDDREPAVIVVGAAQAGLSIAARLNQLGVDTLVVEKWPRIGDSWRKRYPPGAQLGPPQSSAVHGVPAVLSDIHTEGHARELVRVLC